MARDAMAGADANVTDGAPAARHHTPNVKLRQYLTGTWVAAVLIFTIVRVFVANQALDDYGLNPWVFGFIDLATALPYAIGVAKVVTSLIDRETRAAARWGLVAAGSFLAPYLYVAWAGRNSEMPPVVWIVLGLLIVVFGGNALWGIVRKVRQGHHHAPLP